MVLPWCLRTGTGTELRMVQCSCQQRYADAHQSIRCIRRTGRSDENHCQLYGNQHHRQLRTECPRHCHGVDAQGKAVEGAHVEFKIYNYAEFFTVANKTTDAQGKASLSAGLGDMVVYASANDHFGLQKVSFGKDKEVTLTLSHRPGDVFTDTLHIVPPAEKANFPEVTDAQRKENNRRMAQEDSIRNAYVASFPTEEKAKAFAEGLKLDVNQTSTYILKSRGNHADIMQFLSNAAEKGQGARALELLSTLADKDLRDTPCSILEDHLYATDAKADVKEVLAPRIATEMLTPYRTYCRKPCLPN